MSMSDDNYKRIAAIRDAFDLVLSGECKKRCPDNRGFEPKCDFCEVQRIFRTVHIEFPLVAKKGGPFFAVKRLVENEHWCLKYPEGWGL